MYICPNCANKSETPTNFCSLCGSRMVEQIPEAPSTYQPEHRVYDIPQPRQQVFTAEPVARPVATGPSKGKQIAGMGVAIGGFALSILNALYAMIFVGMESGFGFGFAFGFSIFSLPLSLVGLIMSNKCIDEGATAKPSFLGKKFGLVGVILTAVALFFGFINLMTGL